MGNRSLSSPLCPGLDDKGALVLQSERLFPDQTYFLQTQRLLISRKYANIFLHKESTGPIK